MNVHRLAFTNLFLLCIASATLAIGSEGKSRVNATQKLKAAGCAPAQAATELVLNNVRARIETGGNLWLDRTSGSNGTPVYEVPKGGGVSALYAGALWLGGLTPDNNLKVAAVTFRANGNDYWPGPLDDSASIEPVECNAYDRFFKITRKEVELHKAWLENKQAFPGYQVPKNIAEWPGYHPFAESETSLAPFKDVNEDGLYDPNEDYPWYDIDREIDCSLRKSNTPVTLYGDETIWWVFNDKGNIHTESAGEAFGMEIRAQAFAFATSDEVNDMTFYNYTLVNKGTQTLQETYFGQWVDPDLGFPEDDYVGCDVQRGLGYCYNGAAFDPDGETKGYGNNPPAIGVDFFEGPFQDEDQIANEIGIGHNQALNGIGYGDDIVDNERFGMRKFLYYRRAGLGDPAGMTDPDKAIEYYNYLRGYWKFGQEMQYGGTGFEQGNAPKTDFMFPGDSDPLHWGTGGVEPPDGPEVWTEEAVENNPASDRRFIQSAGPFTLEPGDVNNITVGVVYARAYSGNPFASVEALFVADDKAQSLFDNCFQILDGPDAPDVAVQELDREIILYLSNSENSNNHKEQYVEVDPAIPSQVKFEGDTVFTELTEEQRSYTFQGYQVFQLKRADVSPTELDNPDLARLVMQCDLKDSIGRLVNHIYDPVIEYTSPQMMVDGSDEGVIHSFQVKRDLFAVEDDRLINHKTYYYMAIAYAHNEYMPYNSQLKTGQAFPYKRGRKSALGSIQVIAAVPHIPSPEAGGTQANATFGQGFEVTRVEGQGNGSNVLELKQESIDAIMSGAPWTADRITYEGGRGPIDVKVIDPLALPAADFELRFIPSSDGGLDKAHWELKNLDTEEVIHSDTTVEVGNEQLIPEFGISINISQYHYTFHTRLEIEDDTSFQVPDTTNRYTDFLEAIIEFNDPEKKWLTGVQDDDEFHPRNWIRSGVTEEQGELDVWNDNLGRDNSEFYEDVLDGTWAPWALAGRGPHCPGNTKVDAINSTKDTSAVIALTQSVDLIITSDRSKWTRSPVIEMHEEDEITDTYGLSKKSRLKNAPSVNKDGQQDGSGTGMSWFPGYAIDIETGERLNIAFGEDSWLNGENGNDMKWNPTSKAYGDLGGGYAPHFHGTFFGGKHYVFIFKNLKRITGKHNDMPGYDGGEFAKNHLSAGSIQSLKRVYKSVMWVGLPLLEEGHHLLESEVKIKLRVAKPFAKYPTSTGGIQNDGNPIYTFSSKNLATDVGQLDVAKEALQLINVVPNPYYAYSAYEGSKLEQTIKFTNLPEQCDIKIYTVNGTLVRSLSKGNELTSMDWDLRNEKNIPVSSGVYLVHVAVPGVGEKVLKWMGVMRPTDLSNF